MEQGVPSYSLMVRFFENVSIQKTNSHPSQRRKMLDTTQLKKVIKMKHLKQSFPQHS
jgi:hypothetical protein